MTTNEYDEPVKDAASEPVKDAALARAEKAERERDEARSMLEREQREHADAATRLDEWRLRYSTARADAKRLAGALGTLGRCRVCGGVGRRHPPCPYCSDSTHDHECPPEEVCRACDGTGTDPVARAALAAHEEGNP